MTEIDEYCQLATEFVNKLEASINPSVKAHHDNIYFCMEAEPCFSGDDPNPLYYLHYRLSHLDAGRITNIPSIPLPNGKHFFYCTCTRQALIKILNSEEGASCFRAESWEALFESDYEYWDYVFRARGRRRSILGEWIHLDIPFSELVPGDIVEEHHVPGLFVGGSTSVPDMPLSREKASQYIPAPPTKYGNKVDIDPTLYHLFLIDNFGIHLNGDNFIDLPFGLRWWPSSCFPFEEVIFENLVPAHSMNGNQGFTGILFVPKITSGISPLEKQEAYQKVQTLIRRMRTYLDVKILSKMRIVGDVELGSNQNRIYKNRINMENPYPYRSWSEKFYLQKACFSTSSLIDAVEFAFAEPKKRLLHRYIQRSIDSLGLARSLISDSPLAHIIIWAAIEALLSPSDKVELISNITLSLIGLQPHTEDKVEFWDRTKKSYNIRSSIVHSFDIPEKGELFESLAFAEEQCLKVLKFAIGEPMNEGWGRDDLTLFLKKRALT